MTQARREGEKARQRERRKRERERVRETERERERRGERSDDSLSCCTEYDDGTVLSFCVVGECLSSYLFISSSVYRVCCIAPRQGSGFHCT